MCVFAVACDTVDIQPIRGCCASALDVLTFILRGGFVNRNGMVVYLQRERVESHFDEVTDFLEFSMVFA